MGLDGPVRFQGLSPAEGFGFREAAEMGVHPGCGEFQGTGWSDFQERVPGG